MSILQDLQSRSGNICELCTSNTTLEIYEVPPVSTGGEDGSLFACNTCISQIKNIDKFPSNVAIHNKTRVEWIGKGKTFNEINAADSTYRKNVKRLNYGGNSSSIIRDLKYDLKKGWIKKINK